MYYRWGPYFEKDMQNPEYAQHVKEVDAYQQVQELKRRITEMVQSGTLDRAALEEDLFELEHLGWKTIIQGGGGLIEFELIEVESRAEAVRLGYVEE